MRVALFSTCIGDALFPDAHKATAVVLSRLGYDVVFPDQQTCCGQMHVNTGYKEQAIPIIETYVDAFSDPSIDYVVAPSGSCTGAVREQHVQLAERFGSKALVDGAKIAALYRGFLDEAAVEKAGIEPLKPLLATRDKELDETLSTRFADLQTLLDGHRKGEGFVLYTELSKDEVKELSDAVNALSEPLSQLTDKVVG